MNAIVPPQRTTAELLALIETQQAVIDELSISHLGILSPAAIRRALRLTDTPCDLVCLDFRKLHEWNDLLGWDVANAYFGRFVRCRQGLDGRRRDVRGVFGGDEVVMAVDTGDGAGLLNRLVTALTDLTSELTPTQRRAMAERTNRLISGFCAVFVLIENSMTPLFDAERGVKECGQLKSGNVTGARATSGRAGTIVGTLKAGAM